MATVDRQLSSTPRRTLAQTGPVTLAQTGPVTLAQTGPVNRRGGLSTNRPATLLSPQAHCDACYAWLLSDLYQLMGTGLRRPCLLVTNASVGLPRQLPVLDEVNYYVGVGIRRCARLAPGLAR